MNRKIIKVSSLAGMKGNSGQAIERDGKAIAIGIPAAMRNIMPILILMGRAGTPEEAADPPLFLASPLSDYVSGQCLEVTGGF